MKRPLKILVWTDDDGQPRVRIKAGNGRILFASEAYEGGARKALHAVEVLTTEIAAGNFTVDDGSSLQ